MSKDINISNFEEEVIQSAVPVLIDFWAPWCGPCRMVSPIIEQLSFDYQGKIKVVKINVDDEEELASRHNIVSIPCFVIYKDGKVADQRIGAVPKHEIETLIKSLI